MTGKYTTIGSWAVIISKAIDSYGYDGKGYCKDFGVDLREASDPNTRYSTELMSPLWTGAANLSADPLFGLRAGTFVCPSTFHALSVSMWMSISLHEALKYLAKYGRVFSTAGSIQLHEEMGNLVCSSYIRHDDQEQMVVTRHAYEASVSAILSLCRALYGNSFKPLKVEMMHEANASTQDYEVFFACPVSFGHPCTRLYYDLSVMNESLPTANADLLASSERVTLDYLARFDREDVVSQVRSKLIEMLPMGEPSGESVAGALGMSLRNLQRKLKIKDTSYKLLQDDLRQDLAKQLICQLHIPLGEISFRLGFSTTSSFSRAFKRWLGIPPGAYRQQQSPPSLHKPVARRQ